MAQRYSNELSDIAASSDFMGSFDSNKTVCMYVPDWTSSGQTENFQRSTLTKSLRGSVVIREAITDDMINDQLNLQSLITACELPDKLKTELKALQTMNPTLDVCVSKTGKISIKYDASKTCVSFRHLCNLVFQIPRELCTIQVTKETYDKLEKKQKDERGCLIRYRRHVLQGPYYVKCWIHRCLVIILSYGDESNTNCEALLKWIRPTLKHSKKDQKSGKDETQEEVPNDDTEPTDTNNRNYKTKLYVESNEEEVNEIPRHVYNKMDARKIQSVCVPLEGPETDLITQFVQYFSKKAKEGKCNRRLFLEMCICVESGEDTRFCKGRTALEETIDKKMFKCLKLSGFGLEDNCHDSLSPIEVEIGTDSIGKVAEKVDVLVNSSSPSLDLAKGFVEKQICKLGGKTIQEECKEEKKRGTFTYGEVCKTSAGQLQCRKIYHIALYEQWISTCKLSLEILAASVVQCLYELEKDGFKSIAFPALGTGKLGYPYCPVANTMVTVIHEYGKKNPDTKIERVHFYLYSKDEICQTSFRRAKKLYEFFLQSNSEDFIERSYKQLWMPKENMTVQIWPELPPSCTTWRSHIEAYFIFVEGILSEAYRRRLYNYGGFIVTFPDWDESKELLKDLVLTHGLCAVLVDIKDAKVKDCVAYQKNIVDCFENIPCVELLKIVVSKDMFEKLNAKNYENIHRVSKIDVSVWGNCCKEVAKDRSNDSEKIQHQTESEMWMPRFETQLPSKIEDSSDSMISVVYQEPENENESNIRSLITACDLPPYLEEKLKALQTFDQTLNIFVSETGKISLKYDKSKTSVSFQNMCRLIFEIPRTNFTTQVKKETFEKLARKQTDSKGCLIRYRRHNLKGPYYVQCWIHKCLIIILAYGDKSNTNCEALLTWIKSKGQHETAEEVSPDGTEPSDSKNKNYKTVFYVESNEEEVKEIPRHVYKKMEARHIQSVCVPLKGSETNLIAHFVQYFSKKAKKIGRKRKMFLEMCISVEEEEDVIFCEARATLEKAVDPKMFKCLKLSGFGLEDNCHGTLSPIEVELDTDSIGKVAEKVDVLVNSTNTYLDLTRGFVERQIIELGGKTIQEECKREKKKDTFTYGEVCKTSAGLLHCRKIYHVALYEPWIPACKFSLEILAASLVQCLNELEKDGFKSIAFPALGTGKLGYPYYPVAKTMCNVIHAYGKRNPRTKIERIYFFLYDKEELCKNSFRRAIQFHNASLQLDTEDFIERHYKQLWLPKKNLTVQIWPGLVPFCTSGRNHAEAYFLFINEIINVSDRRRLNDYGGFVMTIRDWQESKKAIKDVVLTHGLSSVVVDIKDVHVQCHELCLYDKDILQCFEMIPCVELLKIVVSEDMFHVINPTNSERFVHNVSHIDVYVWGNRCREVREELLNP